MPTIHPDVVAFVCVAQTLLAHTTSDQMSIEQASKIAGCMGRLEVLLQLEGAFQDLI
jgi:hypothetical protein